MTAVRLVAALCLFLLAKLADATDAKDAHASGVPAEWRLAFPQLADAVPAVRLIDAERPIPVEGEEDNTKDQEDGRPIVTLNTRLNNRTIDLRAKHNQAIFAIKAGVSQLFREFLGAHGFKDVQSPALLGAPSEGGARFGPPSTSAAAGSRSPSRRARSRGDREEIQGYGNLAAGQPL